jgi:hypothetical protein
MCRGIRGPVGVLLPVPLAYLDVELPRRLAQGGRLVCLPLARLPDLLLTPTGESMYRS